MNEIGHPAARIHHRRVDGLPVALVKAAACCLRLCDVAAQLRQGVGLAQRQSALQRSVQSLRCAVLGLARLVGGDLDKNLGQDCCTGPTEDGTALCVGGPQVGVSCRDDGELRAVGCQHQQQAGRGVEYQLQIEGKVSADGHGIELCVAGRLKKGAVGCGESRV